MSNFVTNGDANERNRELDVALASLANYERRVGIPRLTYLTDTRGSLAANSIEYLLLCQIMRMHSSEYPLKRFTGVNYAMVGFEVSRWDAVLLCWRSCPL